MPPGTTTGLITVGTLRGLISPNADRIGGNSGGKARVYRIEAKAARGFVPRSVTVR